jgi:hypothetical protein
MATVSVSNASDLQRALDSAARGDVIVLDGGNYGSLSLNGSSRRADYTFDDLTIKSRSGSDPAVFNAVNLANVTNVTFDGVTFDFNEKSGSSKPFVFNSTRGVSVINSEIDGKLEGGHGSGHGLWVMESSDFRLQNTDITDFATAAHFRSIDNLKVIDNSYSGISYDAMFFGRIDGALIEGNSVVMKGEPGVAHRDMIQFWNNDINAPSTDIVIRGNTLTAAEGMTHAIFMSNDVAHRGGGLDSYHKNILIENNTIKSGQVFGILVGQTVDLTIRGNSVLQHAAVDSDRPVAIPVIRVEDSAKDVSITGNTTHRTPEAVSSSNNWMSDDGKVAAGWTISGNRIVSLGTDSGSTGSGGASGGGSGGGGTSTGTGNGSADYFRYSGGEIDGRESAAFQGVDFGEGDRIVLRNFDAGTFRHYAGDNKMSINAAQSYVQLNSLTDIQELVAASKDVSAVFQTTNDTLVVRIAQDDGILDIALPGFAAAYTDGFDSSLF